MKRVEREVRTTWTHTHLLKGKLRTFEDHAMSPGSVQQTLASGEQRRIAYYISQKAIKQGYKSCPIKSINAKYIDDLVRGLVLDHLRTERNVNLGGMEPADQDHRIREAIKHVVLAPEALTIELNDDRLSACPPEREAKPAKAPDTDGVVPTCPFTPLIERRTVSLF